MKKRHLLQSLLVGTMMLAATSAWADKQSVSAMTAVPVIENGSFELCDPTTENLVTAANALGADYTSTGWALTQSGAWSNSGVFTYGSDVLLNGVSAPLIAPDGCGDKALGITVGWGASQIYQSTQEVTLPAGEYTLMAYVYNANPDANQLESHLSFIGNDGTSYQSKETFFLFGGWTVDYVTFTIEESTNGTICFGGKAISGGSKSNAIVFIDNVTFTDAAGLEAAQYAVYETNGKINLPAAKANLEATASEFAAYGTDGYIYASAEKLQAFKNALAYKEPTIDGDANSAAFRIIKTYRALVESNALAEGIEGAKNKSHLIINANATEGDTGWSWTGSKNDPDYTQSWTTSEGYSMYAFFEGGNSNASSWTTTMEQTLTLTPGKYVLTAKGRAAVNTTLTMSVGDVAVEMPHVGATGNVFGNGWNDAFLTFETTGVATIKVEATASTKDQWFSVGNFRLAMLEENIEPVTADEWAAAIAEAEALADPDAVAVGLLTDAIDAAKAVAQPTSDDKTVLLAAINMFKVNNKDQEKDETAKVGTGGEWKKFEGNDEAGVCAAQFAPMITTYDGRNVNLRENYEATTETVGQIIYQNITGLTNGSYKVGFYANAFFTDGRGFSSDMEDGADDVAYVFANDKQEFIVANIATSTTENNFRQFDVEVTDGTIKLGMGKAKPGTNWHSIQIYQLTWFTTAKQVYALDKAEMRALLAEAEQLLTDEYKTNARDILTSAIDYGTRALNNNRLTLIQFEEYLNQVKLSISHFRQENHATFDGVYYVQHIASGKYMAAGHNWGTRAIVNEEGLDMTLSSDIDVVYFDTQVSNGGRSHYLGSNLYMDSSNMGWVIDRTGENAYTISNGTDYIDIDADDNLCTTNTPAEWAFIPAEEVLAARLATLDAAFTDNGVDATFLLKNPNFNRNDQRVSAWTVSEDCTNSNLNGGNNLNNCAESFKSPFTISQVVTGAPAGIYELTAQGFYRQDDDVTESAPQFFANNYNSTVPVKTGDEGNMSAASESFTAGSYTISPMRFTVGEDGALTVGIKGTAEHQWVIFDNFRLTYYGPEGLMYSWSKGVERGGKAVASDEQSVDYGNAGNRTIRLNGKADYSTQYVTISLNTAISAGDKISVTAYRNKNEADKKSGMKIQFADGITATTGDGLEFVNINATDDSNYGTEPNTIIIEVPEGVQDCKELKLTRSNTQTNLFITAFQIVNVNNVTSLIDQLKRDAAIAKAMIDAGQYENAIQMVRLLVAYNRAKDIIDDYERGVEPDEEDVKTALGNLEDALGTSTAINTVVSADADGDAVYNLRGERVDNSYKGVVIVGGKKVVRK